MERIPPISPISIIRIKITAKKITAKLPSAKINRSTKRIARPIVPAINNAEKNITFFIHSPPFHIFVEL